MVLSSLKRNMGTLTEPLCQLTLTSPLSGEKWGDAASLSEGGGSAGAGGSLSPLKALPPLTRREPRWRLPSCRPGSGLSGETLPPLTRREPRWRPPSLSGREKGRLAIPPLKGEGDRRACPVVEGFPPERGGAVHLLTPPSPRASRRCGSPVGHCAELRPQWGLREAKSSSSVGCAEGKASKRCWRGGPPPGLPARRLRRGGRSSPGLPGGGGVSP